MEKRYLLSNTKQYKANLHCHTCISDGKLTPEEVKEAYTAKGYSVVAFTDHERICSHQDLNDENFIAVTGYEYSLNPLPTEERPTNNDNKCYHMNFYAKNPHEDRQICFQRECVEWLYKRWQKDWEWAAQVNAVGEVRRYDYHTEAQLIIDTARENGYLVSINHPYWSLQPHMDYFNLKGLTAIEVYNTGCGIISGHAWYDYGLFCELNRDENVCPFASDDNHNKNPDMYDDSFGGYTMICTDDFSYNGIISAMEKGDVYASTGIDFKEISVCDGNLHAEFTECTDCLVYFGARKWKKVSDFGGITSAEMEIPQNADYIRLLCVDRRNGTNAATKPYKDFK